MHRSLKRTLDECGWMRAAGTGAIDRSGGSPSRPGGYLTTTSLLMEVPKCSQFPRGAIAGAAGNVGNCEHLGTVPYARRVTAPWTFDPFHPTRRPTRVVRIGDLL